MPRKTKLTKELQDRITSVIAAGNYLEVAYRLAGVSHETFYRWLRLGEQGRRPYSEFCEAVKKAEARDLYEESKGKMQELARKQVSEMEELDGAIERAAALNKKVAAVLDGMLPAVRNVKLQRADALTRRKMLAGAKQVGELREIVAHPLLDPIDNANPVMTGRTARQISQAYLDLKGEVFWVLERNGAGAPAEIWPVPPHRVTDTPSATRPTYRVSFRGWQGEIPESEMVWLRDPDLENPYGRGAGIAEALGDELETDEYAAKHTKAWFYNRAVPELLIGVEQGNEEDLRRAKQRWEDEHRGFFRAYRTHWHKGKLDVVKLGQSFQNMQLVELRKYERDVVINVWGVPPEILGIVENSNRATIDASDYSFSRWVLVPRLEFLRAEMQERLVPMFDERLILDYESPVPEDREYNLNVARAAPYALMVDEFRAMMGLEELPDGKGAELVATDAIRATNQVLVDALKDRAADGKLAEEEAATAMNMAKTYFLSHITAGSKQVLEATLGPVSDWLETFLEAKLAAEKAPGVKGQVVSIASPLSSGQAG